MVMFKMLQEVVKQSMVENSTFLRAFNVPAPPASGRGTFFTSFTISTSQDFID